MDDADISEIVEGKLYLGSKGPAADLAALQRRGVTHVVNCTADGIEGAVPNHHERDGVLAYYRLPLLRCPKGCHRCRSPASAARRTVPPTTRQ